MRILIAGGAGFIGTNLSKRLLYEGHEVFCIDNLYSSTKSNVSSFQNNDKYHFIFADITKPLNFLTKIDQIYNLACPASPIHYQSNPVFTIQTNVIGTFNLLELANTVGARFLQASTSEVYGDPSVHPQPETYWGNVNPIGVRSCYDEGKRCAETICVDYAKQNKVDVRIARIFNTYGPFMRPDDGRVVSNFIIQALSHKDITVYGDGQQTRSFQYIDDLINGMIKLMNSSYTNPVNIGNPEEYTINDLAKMIIELTECKSQIIHTELPKDDPRQRKPDITLANTILNWKPSISAADGLARTIDYFRNNI